MANKPRRGWTLLVLAENDSNHRQFRVSRGLVVSVLSVVGFVFLAAIVELIFLVSLSNTASQIHPLRQRVAELEEAETKVANMGKELSDLQAFEQQLRRVLSTTESDTLPKTPWQRTSPLNLDEEFETDYTVAGPEVHHASLAFPTPRSSEVSALPTYPPVRGYITRKFSEPGPYRFTSHSGLDIAAREGTPILAAADGTVLFSGWTYPYGQLLLIAHPSGYSTFYGHNQSLLVAAGEYVLQGQPIGLLGNSGRSTAPHLHFEIWNGDSPVDPLSMLTPED